MTYKEKIARRVLSPEKVRKIEESNNPDLLFTRYWAEKEALLKMVGCGFSGVVNEDTTEYNKKTIVTDQYIISLAY
jgi:phosphopantetheinyl transferase (holo-ACP synthase)